MNTHETTETRDFWNRVARDWDTHVGDDGDSNRILNSDPILWRFAGDVKGLKILDAGCGTGYLTRKLHERGASVIGADFSEEMIKVAKSKAQDIDFRVDSCSELSTVKDGSIDMLISNYVLMDTPDLEATLETFYRVLKVGGVAIFIFSHPCFPQGLATVSSEDNSIDYLWPFPYFDRRKWIDPPWGLFTSEFIWFHRPLSDYWKAFRAAGLDILEFEEPRLSLDRQHLAENKRKLKNSKTRPYSVAFKLQKREV